MKHWPTFVGLLLLTTLVACAHQAATGPAPRTTLVSAEAAELYQAAEEYYKSDFLGKALENYRLIMEQYSTSPQAPGAAFKIGLIYLKKNQPRDALPYFEILPSQYPDNPYAVEANYYLGVCYKQLADYESAARILAYYLSIAQAKNKDEANLLLGDCQVEMEAYGEAIVAYAAGGNRLPRQQQLEVLKKVRDQLEHLTIENLLPVLPRLSAGAITDYLHYHTAQGLIEQGKRAEAAKLLREINYAKPQYKFYAKAEKLLALAETPGPRIITPEGEKPLSGEEADTIAPIPTSHKYAVGVLLPLSGNREVFGREVLHGIMQAVNLFDRSDKGAYRVIVRDTQGEPQTAARLVNELADDPTVLAIIGPLLGETAETAVAEAEKRGVPLITLTTRENILPYGQWTFRNCVTGSDQVKALIRYAGRHQGIFRYAILYPDTKKGRAYRELFAENLDPTTQRLVATASYQPNETDFKYAIAKLRSQGSFDALFVPDNARNLALLAPQLVYYGVKEVTLLGINSWNDDDLARKAGSYLERSVFVDGFFISSHANTLVEPFVTEFVDTFHQQPGFLAALGYDTANLLTRVFEKQTIPDRRAIREGLLGVSDFAGVTGELTISETRETHRTFYLLRVGKSQIEELF